MEFESEDNMSMYCLTKIYSVNEKQRGKLLTPSYMGGVTMISIMDEALAYARQGLAVFPCKPDKKPYTAHGFKDASKNADTIYKWWELYPDGWPGVSTDKANGLNANYQLNQLAVNLGCSSIVAL